ncbi:MAG: protein-S-isoprenylcysteine O-methyltransferase [Bacteroidota bacterium]
MNPIILKVAFVLLYVATSIIRSPHAKRNKQNIITLDKKTPLEKGLLAGAFLGMGIIPLVYVLTPFLNFANYELPMGLQILGLILFIPTLWLFYRSHKDLGQNWSVSLEVRESHTLITNGIYKHIRHPMYTSIWLWVIAQPLVLNNYIAGFGGLIGFGLLYFLRVGQEEKMMLQEFGEAYEAYKQKTKRLVPGLF